MVAWFKEILSRISDFKIFYVLIKSRQSSKPNFKLTHFSAREAIPQRRPDRTLPLSFPESGAGTFP